MIGILIVHVFLLVFIGIVCLHIRVRQLFKNQDYIIDLHERNKLANIPRYSIDGYISRLLEFIKYLENRKDQTPNGICMYRFDLTHHGHCVQTDGFNLHMLLCVAWHVIKSTFSNVLAVVGFILAVLALAISDMGNVCTPYLFEFELHKFIKCVVNYLPSF